MADQHAPSLSLMPPLSIGDLTRLRLDLRGRPPSDALGVHLHRRMGQSLEFREFRHYDAGADIRTVDWAASARAGFGGTFQTADRLLVRSFEAEVRRTVIVVLDTRPAMQLPEAAPKLLIGFWIAACIIEAARQENDRIIFFPLFDSERAEPIGIAGQTGFERARVGTERALRRRLSDDDWAHRPSAVVAPLEPFLTPTAAVVLISDMLFSDDDGRIAAFARKAQKGYRSFHVVEIDSWPHEAALLGAQPYSLGRLEGRSFEGSHFGVTPEFISAAKRKIGQRRTELRHALGGPGLVWPARPLSLPVTPDLSPQGVRDWFSGGFPRAAFLPSLLSRVSP